VQLLASQVAPDQTIPITQSGPDRLFTGNLGRDAGWLLPAACLAAIWGIASRRRRPRGDGLRACYVLWGTWLLILAVTFSVSTYVQTYYTAALIPAVAAILATAAASFLEPGARRPPGDLVRKAGLAIVSAGTTAYAVWLVPARGGVHVPGWLVPVIIAVGAAAVVAVIGSAVIKRAVLATAAVAAALVAALVAPAVASAGLVANHESAFDTPFESPSLASLLASVPARLATLQRTTIPRLKTLQGNAPDLLAAQSSYIAAVFIYTSGVEALPIGGFTGTTPSPTLSQLKSDISNAQFHLVLGLDITTDPRMQWIAAHCKDLGPHTFYCTRPDAG
jgi:4-amino-4-deoxy-L-arabinose transferase-like glycosyltransferase